MPGVRVFTEPVRSAEPPISSGMAGVRAARAAPEKTRVALAGLSSSTLAMWASRAAKASAGSSPLITARVKSAPFGAAASRSFQALRSFAPRRPTARQALAMSSGISKGGAVQPSSARVAATASAPSTPWDL